MTQTPTPRPWRINGVEITHGKGKDCEIIALVCSTDANAAFIVRACNSFDDMLEALEALYKQEDWNGEDIPDDSPIGKARKAIQKARGEK